MGRRLPKKVPTIYVVDNGSRRLSIEDKNLFTVPVGEIHKKNDRYVIFSELLLLFIYIGLNDFRFLFK